MLHPLDVKYASLGAAITHLPLGHPERAAVRKYLHATRGPAALVDVFRVDHTREATRYAAQNDVDPGRLVWHGTHCAVSAAITTSGLRMMPHSGERVGRGFCLAAQNG